MAKKKKKKLEKKLAKSSKPAGGKILKKKLHIGQQKLWNTKLTTNSKAKKYERLSWANFVCANSASHRIFYPSKIICCYFLKSYRKSIFSTVDFNPLFCIKKFRNCRYDNDNYGSPKTLHPSYSPHKQHTYPRIFITKHDCHA